jgi:hypothetical protein
VVVVKIPLDQYGQLSVVERVTEYQQQKVLGQHLVVQLLVVGETQSM